MTQFEDFLQQLATVLQFPSLAPDSNGACLIVMKDGNIPLLFEFDEKLVPNTILLSSPVSAIPIEKRAEIYDASLMGNQTDEEILSIKPDEDLLYLHRRFHPAIFSDDLDILLKSFLNRIKDWKDKVEAITKEPSKREPFPPHPASIQVFPYKA
jgi:Tir chaperone protein (CesT) family